ASQQQPAQGHRLPRNASEHMCLYPAGTLSQAIDKPARLYHVIEKPELITVQEPGVKDSGTVTARIDVADHCRHVSAHPRCRALELQGEGCSQACRAVFIAPERHGKKAGKAQRLHLAVHAPRTNLIERLS